MSRQRTRSKHIKEVASIEAGNNPQDSIIGNLEQKGVTAEERHQLICTAAYLRAERRGFVPGSELEDWLAAEAELEMTLGTKEADSQLKQSS